MARQPRQTPGGHIYHVLNYSAGRIALFRGDCGQAPFGQVPQEAHAPGPLAAAGVVAKIFSRTGGSVFAP